MVGEFQEAKIAIFERLNIIREVAQVQHKAIIGDSIYYEEILSDELTEGDVMHRGRLTLIRRRIRKGKLQRNIRRASIKGYMVKDGKVVRIPTTQRLRMRMKARRASIKRRAKMQQILRKRKISLRKRNVLGIS